MLSGLCFTLLVTGLVGWPSYLGFSSPQSIKFPNNSVFSLCSSGLISALLVLSTICLFTKVSLSPDIITCGWLGLKHQLTQLCHIPSFSSSQPDDSDKSCFQYGRSIVLDRLSPHLSHLHVYTAPSHHRVVTLVLNFSHTFVSVCLFVLHTKQQQNYEDNTKVWWKHRRWLSEILRCWDQFLLNYTIWDTTDVEI